MINHQMRVPKPKPAPRRIPVQNHVDHPSHYTAGTLEVIDIIEAVIESNGTNGISAFLTGTVVKYICRYTHKGAPVEDLKKARWYLDRLIEEAEAHDVS
jgi:hypothetical protein